jgi:Flp pilus assembly protein TadG
MKMMWRGNDAGQAMIEFALLLPMLCYLMIGGIDIARVYAMQLAVQNGARAGAESAAIGYNINDVQIRTHVQQEMGRTPGMDGYNTVNAAGPPSGACPATLNPGENCIYITHPTVSGTLYVTVQVKYQFRTIIAWPLIPNTYLLDRTTTYRDFP